MRTKKFLAAWKNLKEKFPQIKLKYQTATLDAIRREIRKNIGR